MAYTRYVIPFSTNGGLSVGQAVSKLVNDMIAATGRLSIYASDSSSWTLKVTNADYCYMKVTIDYTNMVRFSWGAGPTITNGSSDDWTQVNGVVKDVEIVLSDDMMIIRKYTGTIFYFGHLTSALDFSVIEVYGWGDFNPFRHPTSDTTYDGITADIPAISTTQAEAMSPGEYFLGEGIWYGSNQSVIKSPWLYLGHGPYYMNGYPAPSKGVYDDHRGNAFYFSASNSMAIRI